jgi:hypothetical protein
MKANSSEQHQVLAWQKHCRRSAYVIFQQKQPKKMASNPTLAEVSGLIPTLTQPTPNTCWATSATMMISWQRQQSLSIQDAISAAGSQYLDMFDNDEGMGASDEAPFFQALNMTAEPLASQGPQYYIDLMTSYGPLWVVTDSDITPAFSGHARVLVRISGTNDDNTGAGVYFTFNDPATGSQVTEAFSDFLIAFEQIVTDNPGQQLFLQIVRFS